MVAGDECPAMDIHGKRERNNAVLKMILPRNHLFNTTRLKSSPSSHPREITPLNSTP